MGADRRPDFAIRPATGDPVSLDDAVRADPARVGIEPALGASRFAWSTDASGHYAQQSRPETADLEGQPERRLVVDDYSSQVLGNHHPPGGPQEG